MKNIILFLDGVILSSIWITFPLSSSLSSSYYLHQQQHKHVAIDDNKSSIAEDGGLSSSLVVTTDTNDSNNMLYRNNNTTFSSSPSSASNNNSSGSNHYSLHSIQQQQANNVSSSINNMVYILTIFIIGRTIGTYIITSSSSTTTRRKRKRFSSSTTNNNRLWMSIITRRCVQQTNYSIPLWRIACLVISILFSMVLFLNVLGLGNSSSSSSILLTRFIIGILSGGLITWSDKEEEEEEEENEELQYSMTVEEERSKERAKKESVDIVVVRGGGGENEEEHSILMEEGHSSLLSSSAAAATNTCQLLLQQQTLQKKWFNWYHLCGIATSSILSGYTSHPTLNYTLISNIFHPNEWMYVCLLIFGMTILIYRCLIRYYSTRCSSSNSLSLFGRSSSSSSPSRNNKSSIRGQEGCSPRSGSNSDGYYRSVSQSSSTLISRRSSRQSNRQKQIIQEQQQQQQIITFNNTHHQLESNNQQQQSSRQRLNSNDTFESELFYDCLDDIELGEDSDHHQQQQHDVVETGTPTATLSQQQQHHQTASSPSSTPQNYNNQIAIYSNRRIIYPKDGNTPAYIPAGESLSNIPTGYLDLYKNDITKARTAYETTQTWRNSNQIYNIHTKPHVFFAKIKNAYPHIIHGYTISGMPVVYEKPGQMNLKQLFKHDCSVDDMIFHYCYLMEYLSNMESILTELHGNNNTNNSGNEEQEEEDWQNELAGYAHQKQLRLQTDTVPFGFCVVMDVTGVSPTSLSGDVMVYLKRAGSTNSSHYPGSMRHSIAVQAPVWIGMAWKAMTGVFPASLKVDLLSGKQTMNGGLKEYIDEEQIPVEYGGKSKFRLGEHPFEVGLRKLVERQGNDEDRGTDNADAHAVHLGSSVYQGEEKKNSLESPLLMAEQYPPPLSDSSPTYSTLENRDGTRLMKQQDLSLDTSSFSAATERSNSPASSREWDGLAQDSILTMEAILHFFMYFIVGSLELVLPYWTITPPIRGGMGYEARSSGIAIFATCIIIAWLNKRTRFVQFARCTIEKSPLRGFRIGIGTTCFFLMGVSLIPVTASSQPEKSTLALMCFCGHLSIIFFGITLGIISLERLRDVVRGSSSLDDERNDSSRRKSTTFGRVTGYMGVAPIFRWSILSELSYPLNASFALCLLAGVSWLLYILSFSLHTATPSSAPNVDTVRSMKKESQFMSAMTSWISFGKEVLVVGSSDISFLASEVLLSKKGQHRKV